MVAPPQLVSAVETGLIPIAMAVEISMAESEQAQTLLMDAYESGKIKGKKVAAIRRMGEALQGSADA